MTAKLRDGTTLRGFARGRTNFDIQIQGLDGQFHMPQQDQIAEVREEKQSLIQPVQASAAQWQDLIAYLSNIARVEETAPAGQVLLAKAFGTRQTWTQGIGADGRPLPPPAEESPWDCPADAANWNSAAYRPVTRLFYVLTMEQCRAIDGPRRGRPRQVTDGR